MEEAIRESAIEFSTRTRLLDGSVDIDTVAGYPRYLIDGDVAREGSTLLTVGPPPVVIDPLPVAALCPGYSFTFVDADTFKVSGFDVTTQFSAAKRIRFTFDAVTLYGLITSSSFSAGDTTIEMAMEAGPLLDVNYTVCLVAGNTSWPAIFTDPFSGDSINDICTGVIGSVQWWVIVGNNGKVAASSDKCLNWNLLPTSTSNNFGSCCYDSSNETFWFGGAGGIVANTTDCISVTEDTVSIPALGGSSTFDITGIDYSLASNVLLLNYRYDGTTESVAYTLNQGATWVRGTLSARKGLSLNTKSIKFQASGSGTIAQSYSYAAGSISSLRLPAYNSGNHQSGDALSQSNTASLYSFYDGIGETRIYGFGDGNIRGFGAWQNSDITSISSQINGFAYSATDGRLLSVGNNGVIAYLDSVNKLASNAWTPVSTGFYAGANINAVARNEIDQMCVAVASNGQICRSPNGIT